MKTLLFFLLFPVLVFAKGYGIVTIAKGNPIVQNESGEKKDLKKGSKVYESDTVITSSNSVVRLVMMDTNIIDIYPNSKVLIKSYIYNPKENKKSVNIEVSNGSIKSTVKQKYDDNLNKFNVKTPVIVAGVRGTRFITSHEVNTGISKIFTEEGHVVVGRREANDEVKDFFSVRANQKISIDMQRTEKPKVEDIPKSELEKQKTQDQGAGFAKPSEINGSNPALMPIAEKTNPSNGATLPSGSKIGEDKLRPSGGSEEKSLPSGGSEEKFRPPVNVSPVSPGVIEPLPPKVIQPPSEKK